MGREKGVLKLRKRNGGKVAETQIGGVEYEINGIWWKLSKTERNPLAFFGILYIHEELINVPQCFIFASISLSVYISGSQTLLYIRITFRAC